MNADKDVSGADSRFVEMLRSPWAQAVPTGVLALIPARSYPRWLRRGLIWGPPTISVAGVVYLVATQSQQGRKVAAPAASLAAVGSVFSLTMAFGFWADEKLERGLRRLNVPLPRAVMAAAAGAATWWQANQEKQRDN